MKHATFLLLPLAFGLACSGAPLPVEEEEAPRPGGPPNGSNPSGSGPSTEGEPSSPNDGPSVAAPAPDDPATPDENPFAPVDPNHVAVFDPDYPGLDEALVPNETPEGCTAGLDAETAELKIELDATVWGVRLDARDGVVHANDRPCEDGNGAPLGVESVTRIRVVGGVERNVIILDTSKGAFGTQLLAGEAGFHFDMGAGLDHFLFRGSAELDDLYVGGSSLRVLMSLTATPRINVWLKQAEALTLSTGPGDDTLQDIGRLNVGLYDVDSGSVLAVGDIEAPMRVYGGDGNDLLRTGGLDDILDGGPGNDDLSGLAGNDWFDEASNANGTDVINGGEGLDTLNYSRRIEPLDVTLCTAPARDGCPATECACEAKSGELNELDTAVNVESVRGGAGNDRLVGTDGDDFLYGDEGDDVIEGLNGSDVLQGGPGLDELFGGEDADICDVEAEEAATSCEI